MQYAPDTLEFLAGENIIHFPHIKERTRKQEKTRENMIKTERIRKNGGKQMKCVYELTCA